MKSAKIMMTAIAIFAVAGGALAFKANKFATQRVYYPNPVTTSICDVTKTSFTLTNNQAVPLTFATTIPGAACQLTRVTFSGL